MSRVTGERVTTAQGGFNPTYQRHVAAYKLVAGLLGDARRELRERVPDPAAEVEEAAVGQQRRAQAVGRDVALVGRVEAALGGDDALAGDELHGWNFLDFQTPERCSTSRTAAHSVLRP